MACPLDGPRRAQGILLTKWQRKLPAEWPVTPAAGVLNLTAWKRVSLICRLYGKAPSLTISPKGWAFAGQGPVCLVVQVKLRGILPDGVAAGATCGATRNASGWYPEPHGVEDGFVDRLVVRERTLVDHGSQEWAICRLLGVKI